jgi:hypothetical protein
MLLAKSRIIYYQVIMNTVKWIQQMKILGALKHDDYLEAYRICQEVLDSFHSAISQNRVQSDQGNASVLVVPLLKKRDSGQLMLKLASEAFVLSGLRANLLENFSSDELLHYVRTEHVRYICIVPADDGDVREHEETFRRLKQKTNVLLTLCTDFMGANMEKKDAFAEHIDFYGEIPALIERISLYEKISTGIMLADPVPSLYPDAAE